MGEPRLWRATEKDSSFVSLPSIIRRMREELSVGQDHPLTWEELVEHAKRTGAFPFADEVDPDSDDLTEAVLMLASLWFKVRNPRAAYRRTYNFGVVIVETACQNIASLGDFSAAIMGAHDVAHGEIARQKQANAAPAQIAEAVVDVLAEYFLAGSRRPRQSTVESPLRRTLRGIVDQL